MIARSETGILLTSYDQLRLQRQLLLGVNWGYAILDEGHKIRNPDAEARRAPQPLRLCTLTHTVWQGSHMLCLWCMRQRHSLAVDLPHLRKRLRCWSTRCRKTLCPSCDSHSVTQVKHRVRCPSRVG